MSQSKKAVAQADVLRPLRAMVAAAGIGVLAAACATVPGSGPVDVGNMAYPQPLPQGDLTTTAVSGRRPTDTGNMAYPEPVPAGIVGRSTPVSRQPYDTGNMAYPTPLAAGNGPTTRVR